MYDFAIWKANFLKRQFHMPPTPILCPPIFHWPPSVFALIYLFACFFAFVFLYFLIMIEY